MIGITKRPAFRIAAAIILVCGGVLWFIRAHRPLPPPPLSSTISAGGSYMLAIDADGRIFGWGSGRTGQLGLLDACSSNVPLEMLGEPAWRSVHAGEAASYAIATDGTLWHRTFEREQGCGMNLHLRHAYEPLNWSSHWLKVQEAWGVAMGLDEQHTLWFWQDSEILPEAARDLGGRAQATLSKVDAAVQWQDFCMGTDRNYAVASDGTLWRTAVASNRAGLPEPDLSKKMTQVSVPALFTRVFCRFNGLHILALDTQGNLWGLGDNSYGELATISQTGLPPRFFVKIELPIQRVTQRRWRDVAVGSGFTLAIAADGSLWSWGRNGRGALGTGGRENSGEPLRVDYWHHWAAVSAGYDVAMGLTTGGDIYTWGTNEDGALGDGVVTGEHLSRELPTPTRVSGKKRWMVP
jgi:alpha-tubulin suppressor-like RCC1 family protein